MVEIRLTLKEFRKGPPFPYLSWDEDAVKAWLHHKGFDLKKEIWREDDRKSFDIIFYQEDHDECT